MNASARRRLDDRTDPFSEQAPLLATCYATSIAHRQTIGKRPGAHLHRLGDPDAARAERRAPLQAHIERFDLHAGLTIAAQHAHGRLALEKLLRYCARPPIAQDRLTLLPDGRIALALHLELRRRHDPSTRAEPGPRRHGVHPDYDRLAGWIGESDDHWDTTTHLGMLGDELYLVEIDASNRERVLRELIDHCEADDRGLRIEIVFFGDAGGFFASSLNFLELWPKSPAEVPADVLVDDHYRAAFTSAGDEIVVSVRHARRPGDGPPRRRFRFRPDRYQEAMLDLARQSRRLRDDLIAVARQRAPDKVESLREAFTDWPA